MARYGINVDARLRRLGPELRRSPSGSARDHELALALWATGNHEARLLAAFVDDPAASPRRSSSAGRPTSIPGTSATRCAPTSSTRRASPGRKAAEWAGAARGVRQARRLRAHGRPGGPRQGGARRAFSSCCRSIEREACDERNFVKKAVNWALRNIGKRNLALNAAAIACAQRIRAAADERAGGPRGGDAAPARALGGQRRAARAALAEGPGAPQPLVGGPSTLDRGRKLWFTATVGSTGRRRLRRAGLGGARPASTNVPTARAAPCPKRHLPRY